MTSETLGERMTWEEIYKKYGKRHIGLKNIEWSEKNRIISAEVAYSEPKTSYDELLYLAADSKIEFLSNPAEDYEIWRTKDGKQ